MFFFRSTIDINGFSMVFPNSGAMISDGFDLEKDLKMRIIVTDPILRELCVLFRIQITLLLVNFMCKSTLKDSIFLIFKVGCCVFGLSALTFATIANFQWFSKLPSPLNGMVEGNHWDQWFSDGFLVRQPLVTMVFDGCAPLVRRWNGYVPSSKSSNQGHQKGPFWL